MKKIHSTHIGVVLVAFLLLSTGCALQPGWNTPYLTSLKLVDDTTGAELSFTPPFDPGIQEYSAVVPASVTKVALACESFPSYGATRLWEVKPLAVNETVTLKASVWTHDQWHANEYFVTVRH
jgi:hypothetical protein